MKDNNPCAELADGNYAVRDVAPEHQVEPGAGKGLGAGLGPVPRHEPDRPRRVVGGQRRLGSGDILLRLWSRPGMPTERAAVESVPTSACTRAPWNEWRVCVCVCVYTRV